MGAMYLMVKGKKAKRICRVCEKPHVGRCRIRDRRLVEPVTMRTLRLEGKIA